MALKETYTQTADNLFAGTQVMPVVAGSGTIAAAGEGEETLVLRGTLLTTTDGKTYTPAGASDDVLAVLAADAVNATAVTAPLYFTGEFNKRAVIVTSGDVDDYVLSARKAGIFIKDTVAA